MTFVRLGHGIYLSRLILKGEEETGVKPRAPDSRVKIFLELLLKSTIVSN